MGAVFPTINFSNPGSTQEALVDLEGADGVICLFRADPPVASEPFLMHFETWLRGVFWGANRT